MDNSTPRRLCAAALLIAPGLLLAGHLVQATPGAHDTASELASIAAARGRAEVSTVLGVLGLALMVPAVLGLAAPLWRARPRAALVGTSMSVAGIIALVALMGSGPLTVAMTAATADRAQMVALSDRYESSWVTTTWMLVMLVGWTLGPVVLAVGRWRAGEAWLVPVLLVVGVGLMVADAGRWPQAAAMASTWLALAVAGLEEARRDSAGAARGVVRVPQRTTSG